MNFLPISLYWLIPIIALFLLLFSLFCWQYFHIVTELKWIQRQTGKTSSLVWNNLSQLLKLWSLEVIRMFNHFTSVLNRNEMQARYTLNFSHFHLKKISRKSEIYLNKYVICLLYLVTQYLFQGLLATEISSVLSKIQQHLINIKIRSLVWHAHL